MLVNGVDTNKLIVEKFLKRLEQLSLRTIGEIPQLEELNEEQAFWTKSRMKWGWCKQ